MEEGLKKISLEECIKELDSLEDSVHEIEDGIYRVRLVIEEVVGKKHKLKQVDKR